MDALLSFTGDSVPVVPLYEETGSDHAFQCGAAETLTPAMKSQSGLDVLFVWDVLEVRSR